jgi:hypothetical protein
MNFAKGTICGVKQIETCDNHVQDRSLNIGPTSLCTQKLVATTTIPSVRLDVQACRSTHELDRGPLATGTDWTVFDSLPCAPRLPLGNKDTFLKICYFFIF